MPVQVHEPQRGLNFDDVWVALMELRESQKETERLMRESWQEAQWRMQETDCKISRLGSCIGDLIEHLTTANILEQFKDKGYEFTRISRNNKLKDANNRTLAEIDILLENGDFAMVVEVKSLLTLADVKDHIKRMRKLRQYADEHRDTRKYVSSVSGALIEDAARDFALEKGIYVIEHTGDTIQIKVPGTVQTW
jgi:Holliday junction resolvase-like predicted endonuclease